MTNAGISNAKAFFERITSPHESAVSTIRSLVNSSPLTFENEWRDFKGQPKDDNDLKHIWSKAVSGFANTGGGVVIWGIDCKKENDIDAACGFRLIQNPASTLSRLKELLPEAVEPPVQGIQMEYFEDPTVGGQGFIVCYIPESSFKPIRAEFASRQYYIRVSDRFEICPVPLLRSLFTAKGEPRFELFAESIYYRDALHGTQEVVINFEISNVGTQSGREIAIKLPNGAQPSQKNFTITTLGNSCLLNWNETLHPGQRIPIFKVKSNVTPETSGGSFYVTLYSIDSAAVHAEIEFSIDELKASAKKRSLFKPLNM
jgi:hypothetical protein